MISEGWFRLRVQHEKKEWGQMMPNDFTRGVVKGLDMLQRMAKDIHRVDLERQKRLLACFSKLTAQVFWQTIMTAEAQLARGDRAAALRRLRQTIEKYQRTSTTSNGHTPLDGR